MSARPMKESRYIQRKYENKNYNYLHIFYMPRNFRKIRNHYKQDINYKISNKNSVFFCVEVNIENVVEGNKGSKVGASKLCK